MKAHSQKSTVKEMTRMFKWYIFKYLFNTNEGHSEGEVV